ncbi:MDR family MFS transporter [Mucilaginibacter segetis]|uniref:MFS transporter n=1 Tax=Mucilaginibacter segetis TaxID=2793071 RepID=A0A934UMQ8_9SPHI|nr:MFS transporter [Mucilaginibacter segetis]MBK0379147.1 MFS transporter [Mucilaginibacter segetis]
MQSSVIKIYKNAYSGLSINNWYLSIVMLINRSGTMVVPFMTIYCINQLHFTVVQAGYIMALFGLGSIIGAFTGGKLTDKFGFYDVQAIALISGGLMFILVGYQHTFITLGIGTFVLSFCNEAFRPANSTAIAHYSAPKNKTRSYSLHRLAVNLGWAVGAALGGFLASFNYHLLFWVDGCTNIFAGLLLLKLIPRSGTPKPSDNNKEVVILSSAYKDKVYLLFIFLITLFSICFFQFFIMEPVFYKLKWHFNVRFIGFLLALNGLLIALVEMVLINYLEGKKHTLIYITYGVIITGFGFVLLNVLPPSAFAGVIVVVVITMGEMVSMPFMNSYWIARSNNNNRGQYAALYTISWSTAQVIAPALGSQVIVYGDFKLLWWLLGAICLIVTGGLIIMYRFRNNDKRLMDALNENAELAII